MLRSGAAKLMQNRKEINDLNVFPIPDGDTGDNMYMTIQSGCRAIPDEPDAPLFKVASCASSGMLMGARGNSGVILSRIFAGIAKGFDGCDSADAFTLAKAMESGVREAYAAVSNPVEGTILTVFKDGVAKAASVQQDGIEAYFDIFCEELALSLERTPHLLDVLRKAGVVDSGGAGFVCIAEGMRAAVKGESVELEAGETDGKSHQIDLSSFSEDSVLEFGYCTEFLLRLQRSKVDLDSFDETVIKDYLNSVGESVVTFREGSIVKVHVHTKTPGEILNHCQKWGEFLTLKIENMTLQHNEINAPQKVFSAPTKPVGIVAVASGAGIVSLFKDMGADIVIEGGQTMNPSSEDFLKAIEQVNAETIYVLPNNSNIVMSAQQAASLCRDAHVVVLPAKSLGAGYTLLGSVDFAETAEEDVVRLSEEICGSVATGMVSKAVRDAEGVREGEYLAFNHAGILGASASRRETLSLLCRSLGASESDVVLVIKGEDVPSSEADAVAVLLQSVYPKAEVVMVDGGQPVYDYIVILQ